MKRFARDNGLTLFFAAVFLLSLVGQALTGLAEFNNQQVAQGLSEMTLGRYVTSSDFVVDVAENWQSEYLQFLLFVWVTVWFIQRGSPESKEPGKQGRESDEDQRIGEYADENSPQWARVGGLRTALYSRSLTIVMGLLFLGSWLA